MLFLTITYETETSATTSVAVLDDNLETAISQFLEQALWSILLSEAESVLYGLGKGK
jgi:hypothetical protein